jgi:hypothetical protein
VREEVVVKVHIQADARMCPAILASYTAYCGLAIVEDPCDFGD